MMPIQRVLQQTFEHAVPDWIEQSRRLGGLLIGVAAGGRPVSLAHEAGDADVVLRDCR